jgi:hypothetical protein
MLTTAHIQRILSWMKPWVDDLGPEWVKIVNPPRGPDPFPGKKKAIRIHTDGWDQPYVDRGRQGGRDYVRKMYDEHWRHYLGWGDVAFELWNEKDCNSNQGLINLREATLGAMEEAAVLGIKLIILNIAEGNPNDNGLSKLGKSDAECRQVERWKWEQLAEAVKVAVNNGHIIGRHCYWRPDVEGPEGRYHALGRLKWDIDQLVSMGVDGDKLKVLVNETGIDGGIAGHEAKQGWRVLSSPDAYRAEIVRAERYARTIPQVVGLCYFTFGYEGEWVSFDVDEGFARSWVAPLKAIPATAPIPSTGRMAGYLGHAMTVAEFDKKLAASDFAREITEIILHHSATRDCDSLPALDRMMDSWEYYWRVTKGWTEGVFGLVSQCGFGQFMALGAPNRGAGFASKTRLNLEVLGTFTTIPPTGTQWANLVQVCAAIKRHAQHDVTITTHRDYNPSTQCPGDAFLAKVPQLIQEIEASMVDPLIGYLESPDTIEEVRRIAYEAVGITGYIKGSALTKAARKDGGHHFWRYGTGVGRAISNECKRAWKDRILIVQGFEDAIAYCVEGHYDPSQVRLVDW